MRRRNKNWPARLWNSARSYIGVLEWLHRSRNRLWRWSRTWLRRRRPCSRRRSRNRCWTRTRLRFVDGRKHLGLWLRRFILRSGIGHAARLIRRCALARLRRLTLALLRCMHVGRLRCNRWRLLWRSRLGLRWWGGGFGRRWGRSRTLTLSITCVGQ